MVVLPLYRSDSRLGVATLLYVGKRDWLENGHGDGERLQPIIDASAADGVSILDVLRRADRFTPRSRSRRATKALVGWVLYCGVAAGGTAAAWTVRATLFPSPGAPTPRSVWENSSSHPTRSTESEVASTATADTSVDLRVAAAAVNVTVSSINGQTVPTASLPGAGPNNTVDDHGSDQGSVPETGTTLPNTSSGSGPSGSTPSGSTPSGSTPSGTGPSSTGPSGSTPSGSTVTTVTTVADQTTNPSTVVSSSTTPDTVDPPQTTDPVITDTTDGHQSGKGGGGGGNGDGTTIP